MAKLRILFFIAGMVPTEDERKAATKIGNCVFRNSSNYEKTTSTEVCDFVAGLIPDLYSDFPRLEEKKTEKKLEEIKLPAIEKKVEETKVVWSSNS